MSGMQGIWRHGNLYVPWCDYMPIPMELEEVAKIDGASRLKIYGSLFLPLLKTTVVTLVIIDSLAI